MKILTKQYLGGIVAGIGLGFAITYWLSVRFDVNSNVEIFILGMLLISVGSIIRFSDKSKKKEKNQNK